ncbi:AAA family ATPase [Streptomyces ochraceiscleroticus]|uniref:Nuclease SbcCD subunit C n=1 Tax=Streptomyces ochraceiscleroticus TaxID=47761 RepID=A0ABW1MMI0_9ACTN|nr:SMC family ATPase [Streptomyces ochraceiscleroticus]
MKLHRLTLTAFGPFGAAQTVDFDRLSGAGLFLLHGPTGAGKTSVLDAVCFALYGSVPGARPGGQSLRSALAAPGTSTGVVLDLTVADRRLEITRRPEQPRLKKRGTGTTMEKAYSALREYDPAAGEWKALSRSHQEIGEEIQQLLGMSKEQFCQVVLLPQGEFAKFLRADAEARAKLLGRLFDTRRFAALEERLAVLRKTAADRVTAADDRLLALAHRMAQAAGDTPDLRDPSVPAPGPAEEPATGTARGSASSTARGSRTRAKKPAVRTDGAPAPGEPGFDASVLAWAAVARAGARERLEIAEAAATTAETAAAEAARTLEETLERARLQQRHAEARRRADALEAQTADRDRARQRLDRARKAQRVAPGLALRDAAWRDHVAAQAAERRSRERLRPDLVDAGSDQLAALEHRLRGELGSLDAARRDERRAADIATERAALDREARADEQTLLDAADWLTGWEATRTAHQHRIETAQEAAARAEQLGARLEPAEARLAAARRRDRATAQLADAERELLRARESATEAHEEWLKLREARLHGIAAELAKNLEAGAPCAVCGATEHPAPARTEAGHVDREREEAAFAAYERAVSAREEAERAGQSVKEELAAATAGAGNAPVAALAQELEELRAEHNAAHATGAGLHAAREALAHAEREYEQRRAEQQAAQQRTAARDSRREALDREENALAEGLRRARGDSASVAERAHRLERQTALLAEAVTAVRDAETAAERLKEADAALADAAYKAGFDTPREAAAALLSDDEWRRVQGQLDAWQAEEVAVAAELADPRTADAAALPPADTDRARAASDAAARRLREAATAQATARERCAELDRLSARAEHDARELAPLRAEYDRVARLASLTAGTSADNERKMRLESYVLAARLEQVAAAASARLTRMSGGRYTLVHSDERAGGARRSGLGLHVIDAWTGQERDTAGLSGGETFFASLSLALGLADVVTDEAGGTRLDTLFIDEGFGSLDEQTLDEVLDVLDSLRERDRSVGIVSHVADLRQRIPAQLEVVKNRAGSSVRLRTPESAG